MYSRAFPFGAVKKLRRYDAGGLVWFGGTLACGFFLGLLALPVRADKSVDGIIAGDVDRFGFRVHPLRLPIGDGEPCFKRRFASRHILCSQPSPLPCFTREDSSL